MKLRDGIRYIAIPAAISFAAFEFILAATIHRGYDLPQKHPLDPSIWVVERDALSDKEWFDLEKLYPILGVTWFFVTSGATTTLPSDFNTGNNQVTCIGAGAGGAAGANGFFCMCSSVPGSGGAGGGGGAFSRIPNYSAHVAGDTVNVLVGAGDTWFDTSGTVLAKAASGATGGQAASGVGVLKFSGGNGGTSNNGGGGGGGAAGPHGAGNNGSNSTSNSGAGGGTGDAGNTAAGANGTQFDPTHGSGGGNTGGNGGGPGAGNGTSGSNGGQYGGGGGGGGGGGIPPGLGAGGGNGFQGLIAISYTPFTATGFTFFID